MERCIKWLNNWVEHWGEKNWREKVEIVISLVLSTILGILLFSAFDKVPATLSDYKPLKDLAIAVQENPLRLFETDREIYFEDGVIQTTFENKECKIVARYTKSCELISISESDNCMPWPLALILALIVGIIFYMLISLILMMVLTYF